MNTTGVTRGRLARAILLASTAAVSACGWPEMPKPPATGASDAKLTTYHTTETAGAIVLRDGAGAPIARGSTTPYSPERTCGACHDVATVTEGYHFQQGRTNLDGSMRVSDTFNPQKSWLLSDGMYGKT